MSKRTKRARNRPPPPTAGKDWLVACPHADAWHHHIVSWRDASGGPAIHCVTDAGGVVRKTPYLWLCEACYGADDFVIGDVMLYSETLAAGMLPGSARGDVRWR